MEEGLFCAVAAELIGGVGEASQVKYAHILGAWLQFLALHACQPEDATEILALMFMNNLRKKSGVKLAGSRRGQLAKKTIRGYAVILNSMYKLALNSNAAKRNPFTVVLPTLSAEPDPEKRVHDLIDFDQIRRFADQPDPSTPEGLRDSVLISLLLGGGLRISEVLNLRISSLSHTPSGTPFLLLFDTKSRPVARQAIPTWAARRVEKLIELRIAEGARKDAYLMQKYTRYGGRPTGKQLRREYAYSRFKAHALDLKICNVTPHSARATAICKLLAEGIPHREVKEFSRHASVQMVEYYDRRVFRTDDIGKYAEKIQ